MTQSLAGMHWPGIGLRAGVVAGALVVWFWTQSLIARKSAPQNGIGDIIHDLTAPWHQYFFTHPRAANAALFTSSIFIDLCGILLIGAAVFGATFAPFLAILIVFALRQICQGLSTLPPPPGIIWRNPGFPALLVTYDVGNDFFFSGHTALAVLGALEAAYLGPPWLAALAACVAVGEMVIVLVLRAHYTLDVVAGALAAFLAAAVAGKVAPGLDAWLR
ncbi:MAG TPA: phosphatase PAP2-related protein [Verrucomicrobiae bacterium]|nr:phosphatase PAP2-related protein [Verrucomicrobiae bacterium]